MKKPEYILVYFQGFVFLMLSYQSGPE